MLLAVDHADSVVFAVEADAGVGHVIGDDQIEIFVAQLARGVLQQILGFCGETDAERAVRAAGQRGENVRVAHHLQQQAVAGRGVFLQFVWCHHFRAVVGYRRSGNKNVAGHRRFARGEHVAGADHVDALHAIGRRQEHRAGHQRHSRTGLGGRLGQSEAHLAGAVVGDVANRVDVFLGWTCSDQQVLARQQTGREAVRGGLGEFVGLEHAAHADVAAGLAAGTGAEQTNAAFEQQFAIGLCGGVGPHGLVHGWCQGDRGIGRQHHGGQQIIGDALRQAGHEVGGGRRDQHEVCPASQFDVPHGRFRRGVEQVQVDGMAGERLQGEGGDELAPALGHHHPDFGAMVAQAADQFGALVGGDAAADTQDDAFTLQPLHGPAFLCCEREWIARRRPGRCVYDTAAA